MGALSLAGIDFTEDLEDKTADILQCSAQGLRTLWLIKKFKKQGKKTIIYSYATAEEWAGAFRALSLFQSLYKRYLSYLYNLADVVISPSLYTKNLLEKEYGVPANKIIFISCGVDVKRFSFDKTKREAARQTAGIKENQKVVANVAILLKKKGADVFINLARIFPEVIFSWYGKKFSRLFAAPITSQSPNLTFHGFVEDIVPAYCSADIFMFPSYEENQGISVLEAGAIGLAVIVRDIPVYEGWMEDGVNCLKAKNDDEFKEKLEKLLDDKNLQDQLGKNMREMILSEHSLEAIGKRLSELYQKILDK